MYILTTGVTAGLHIVSVSAMNGRRITRPLLLRRCSDALWMESQIAWFSFPLDIFYVILEMVKWLRHQPAL